MDPQSTDPVLSDRIKSIVATEKQIDDMMKWEISIKKLKIKKLA